MTVPRFWREIPQRYNLIGSKCGSCGTVDFPPRTICPHCRRKSIGKMEDIKLSGKGEIVSYSIVREAPEGFEIQVPYAMALIKLDDGPTLTAQIVDCELEEVKIGARVEAVFRRIQEESKSGVIYYGYKFQLAMPQVK
ncbi:MAG: Zn-ribbon domain-containing OB-fold protein [Candidatus Thermoplasmatota archaeon]|nr:Zn-ribbon domain-containing OB-fold protein [Candidatus Thermoplasmatota archaeon]